jgi:hypothetical protein
MNDPTPQPPPPTARPLSQPADPPLSDAHYSELRDATAALRPVRRAAATARFSANTILIVAIVALPFAVLSLDPFHILVAAGVCAIGVCEFVGAGQMARGEPAAASFLGRNQLLLLGLIIVYCVVRIVSVASTDISELPGTKELGSALGQLQGTSQDTSALLESWVRGTAYLIYALVILLSAAFQGGLAAYYFTRKRPLESARDVRPWVRRVIDTLQA